MHPQTSTPPQKVYQAGRDPATDAWFTSFYIENHLDFLSHPDHAATIEKVRFMVYTDARERYYPCSDRTFQAIMSRNQSGYLQSRYEAIRERIIAVVESLNVATKEKTYLKALIQNKYAHETRDELMIPSRLEKRLMKIFLDHSLIEDPFAAVKADRNRRVQALLDSTAFAEAFNHVHQSDLENPPDRLSDIKRQVEYLELMRLISLATENRLWEDQSAPGFSKATLLDFFNHKVSAKEFRHLFDRLCTLGKAGELGRAKPKKILWLANEAGEFMVDLAIINYLATKGHKIIIAFKQGPVFTQVSIIDTQNDAVLAQKLGGVRFIREANLSKNDLLDILQHEHHIFALPDGTHENLNLLLCTTSFIRFFKEVDLIISRGHDQKRRFFDTHFQFTQDIFNIARRQDGSVAIAFKPRHPAVIKFSHQDLEQKANDIIAQMQAAHGEGKKVVFYSGIIGSIPGRIDMAKKIMSVFVAHLLKQSAMTFIINPSEYFEQGMDADDLMYMWEIVQCSGYIDIWRFQSYEDIVQAFKIMEMKVPAEWVI